MKDNANRINWIDMAKGYGILLVMLGHLVIGTQLARWIYTFHMPLFFFLSGYVFSARVGFFEFIKRKCKSIIIPYFGMGLCIIIFELIYYPLRGDYPFTIERAVNKIRDLLIQNRAWILWYLACLFWLNILFYIVIKVTRTVWIAGIVSLLIAIGGYNYYSKGGIGLPWDIDVCLIAIIFFYLGYLMKYLSKRIDNKFNLLLSNRYIEFALIIILLFANIYFARESYLSCEKYVDIYYGSLGNPLYSFPSAVCGILVIVILSKLIIYKPIRYFGENSIVYYALHQSIMIPLSETILGLFGFNRPDMGTGEYWIYNIIQLLFLLVTLTGCSLLFNKTRLGILIGKNGKIYEKSH